MMLEVTTQIIFLRSLIFLLPSVENETKTNPVSKQL